MDKISNNMMNIQKKNRTIIPNKPKCLPQNDKNKKIPADKKESQKKIISVEKCSNLEKNQKLNKNRQRSNSPDSSTNSTKPTTEDNNKKIILPEDNNNKTSENNVESSEKINKNEKTLDVVLIKNTNHDILDNNVKIPDNKDKITAFKEGELPSSVSSTKIVSTSLVPNISASTTVASAPSTSNRVFIIKNLAGKSVTIIPKSTPVVLNQETNTIKPAVLNVNKCVLNNKKQPIFFNINKDGLKTVRVKNNLLNSDNKSVALKLDQASQCKNLIQNLPNTGYMKITDLNKSQKYFTPSKVEAIPPSPPPRIIYTEVPKQCTPQVIDLTDEKDDMQNNASDNKMPNFSKILQALTESPDKNSGSKPVLEDIKIPIYVDCQTQTENIVNSKDIAVQTEVYMPSPTPSFEDLPNITNLLEYVLSTPKYSSGLDDMKKTNLIDMSKNIVVKEKEISQAPTGEEALKKQLFIDLKDCATFDFLGQKPIHNAVLENNLRVLKRQIFALRIRKISLDVENNSGQTALQIAVSNNCNIEIISTLLGNGASPNILDNEGNNLIHLAVINSTHFVLEILIKYLQDPVKEINRKNDEGLTSLMIASIDSKPEMVDMLLRNRADPNLRDEKSGRTALFHAVELNCNFVINLLLKYKADPKVRNFFGLTALDAARDLDISDSKILESDKDSIFQSNQTSVIVNMNNTDKNVEKQVSPGKKRTTKQNGVEKESKKSKLSFVPSLMKVKISEVKNVNSGKRRKK